ncbi:transposase [Streptomyces sp. NPDC007205]|uniref:IS110 family transposase n=1 Tax=Streptomyces sp. NPDC007205 TaxID=3154316 RepID=UPI0033C00626
MAAQDIVLIGGIDTHADFHQAAVIDSIGRHLATEQFETTPDGYRRLMDRLRSHGDVLAFGVERTGAYRAEIARFLTAHGITVVEVDRPDRKARRDNGTSDPIDACAAATAVLSSLAGGTPKARNGTVEAIRSLRVVRKSAFKARTQAINQIRTLIVTAPSSVRDKLRGLSTTELVETLARSRSHGRTRRPGLGGEDSTAQTRPPLPGTRRGDQGRGPGDRAAGHPGRPPAHRPARRRPGNCQAAAGQRG